VQLALRAQPFLLANEWVANAAIDFCV